MEVLEDGRILITEEEFEEFMKPALILNSLDKYGVDSWEGYGEAMEDYQKELEIIKSLKLWKKSLSNWQYVVQ